MSHCEAEAVDTAHGTVMTCSRCGAWFRPEVGRYPVNCANPLLATPKEPTGSIVRLALRQEVKENIIRDMLYVIGEDGQRQGLQETPKRVVAAWKEWFSGYGQNPADVLKTFEDGAEKCNEMVVLDNIPIYSHCEHHLAPFVGTAVVGYIPDGRIVGLSKIPRLVNIFARRLQVQERLTNQIAEAMMEFLEPKGVGVVIRAEHFCMATRGVHIPGVMTTTSALRGVFREVGARAEFLDFANRRK